MKVSLKASLCRRNFPALWAAVIFLLSCSEPPASPPPGVALAPAEISQAAGNDAMSDRDADGFPDAAELPDEQDRLSFRRWFVTLAESQLYKEDPAWRQDDHDCAGLLRFAYREALKRHDTNWLRRKPFLREAAIADVRRFQYPNVPLLATRIFRTGPGSFRPADLQDTTFAVTATAGKLRSHNTVFLGKTLEQLLPGDLLFYLNPGDVHMPQHSMIFAGAWQRPPSWDDGVIYHTGPRDDHPGALKLVRLADLRQHPEERWHPVPENPYFLGFYRWKILE